jgi:NAD(P)-dependent dehydrogenase (short-subunit alcohol dehydrogenase family)
MSTRLREGERVLVTGCAGGFGRGIALKEEGATVLGSDITAPPADDGIRVNAIAPGAIPGGGFVADNLDALVAQIPLGRIAGSA